MNLPSLFSFTNNQTVQNEWCLILLRVSRASKHGSTRKTPPVLHDIGLLPVVSSSEGLLGYVGFVGLCVDFFKEILIV